MRKRNCKNLFDNIMWYTIYMLPIILTIVMSNGVLQGMTFVDWQYIFDNTAVTDYGFITLFRDVLQSFGIFDNPIYETLVETFGPYSNIPLVGDYFGYPLFGYMAYFVTVYIFHLMVDFLLFIPRLAHKWLNSFTRSDD